MKTIKIHVLSDAVGETAEVVARAAISQFGVNHESFVYRHPYVITEKHIDLIIDEIKNQEGDHKLIIFSMVIPKLKEYLLQKASEQSIMAIDILTHVIEKIASITQSLPELEPGLVHKLDQNYFKKIEAVEFAVKYDDGKDPRGLLLADVILIGISRTSKTPLSMYLAHKGIKATNVPLVPEVMPPDELFQVDASKIVGLTINIEQLMAIRMERLKALGLDDHASYATPERIFSELNYSETIMKKVGCEVLNVSSRAVEETANIIIAKLNKGE